MPNEIEDLRNKIQKYKDIISDQTLFEKNNELFIQSSQKIGLLQLELEEKEERWLELMELEDSNEIS